MTEYRKDHQSLDSFSVRVVLPTFQDTQAGHHVGSRDSNSKGPRRQRDQQPPSLIATRTLERTCHKCPCRSIGNDPTGVPKVNQCTEGSPTTIILNHCKGGPCEEQFCCSSGSKRMNGVLLWIFTNCGEHGNCLSYHFLLTHSLK